jgi:hypothetical protein
MVDWLRSNPVLWNKRLTQYKDTAFKEALWDEQARKLGKDKEMIQVWYRSLRTRYGRLK